MLEVIKISNIVRSNLKNKRALLACVSSSPFNSKVICNASKMAESFGLKFIALYVETDRSHNFSKTQSESLNSNLNLAERLGAEIVTVYGDNISEQIMQYAKFRNVSKIVIGKNYKRKDRLFNFYAKDIVDKLMDSSSSIDICIIPSLSDDKKPEKPKIEFKISFIDILKAVAIMTMSTVISMLLNKFGLSEANTIMAYILGVIIIYIVTTGYLIGIISSIIEVVLFNYLFVSPRLSLIFYDKNYLATFFIMTIVSFIIGSLTTKIQKEAYASFERERSTQNLYLVSKKLLSAMGNEDIVNIGIKYISRLVNRTIVCYLVEDNNFSRPFVYRLDENENTDEIFDKDEKNIINWCLLNTKEAGAGTDDFKEAKNYYMPIKGQKKVIGIIGVSCDKGLLKPEQKFIFKTVISQMAVAMDRENLLSKQETYKMQIDRERLRSDLLRSISHDLRSPLTGIKGSVGTIIDSGQMLPEDTKKELLQGIYEDAEWLIRLVENILSMTKFDEGKMKIEKNLEAVEEVVSEAVQRIGKDKKDHKIKVNIPEELILVSMDGNLIEQVIINLIDNAIKFTQKDSLIEVKVYEQNKDVFFEVSDNGPGIKEEILPNIFDRFFTNGSKISDSRRGVGLGLAICKSIVEAHGGVIEAFNKKDGGALFKFNIPK